MDRAGRLTYGNTHAHIRAHTYTPHPVHRLSLGLEFLPIPGHLAGLSEPPSTCGPPSLLREKPARTISPCAGLVHPCCCERQSYQLEFRALEESRSPCLVPAVWGVAVLLTRAAAGPPASSAFSSIVLSLPILSDLVFFECVGH